ncbi:glycine zipper 2TM domain-containing protein [Sphingomonas paucimobilis]|uniref:glycine zipper 2TM domain-containing protein n=1 Tax=Sphingomonas paucimobilis TaxID=13689 RepID=UPI0013EE50FA|nr:glycine zipper 2TM domain-containing protein [Sphingomonas paucimobilis]
MMRLLAFCLASLLLSATLIPNNAHGQSWHWDGYDRSGYHDYRDGYDDGGADGYRDGHDDGYEQGRGDGYHRGYADARDDDRPVHNPCRAQGGAGALLGAVGGGLAGHLVAGRRDKLIGTALGALAGGVAGDAIHRRDRCR